jgi:hypothetical protein
VTVVAGLRQIVSAAGAWRGHRGEIDRRGRIYSGTPDDDAMREAAASIAGAARAEGHHGPCGIDGFTFALPDRPGEPTLRPIIEFNARFTMGHVAAGWMRRLLPWLVETRGLQPGRRIGFVFALAPPPQAQSWLDVARELGGDVIALPFATSASTEDARRAAAIDPARPDHPAEGGREALEPSVGGQRGPAIVVHDDPALLDALVDRIAPAARRRRHQEST